METTQPELRTVRLQSWEWSTLQHGSVICLVAGQHLAKTMLTHIGDRSVWSLFGNGNHLISADSRDEFIAKCNEYLVTAFY